MTAADIFRSVWRHKLLFIVVFYAVVVAGVAVQKFGTRIYEADLLIFVDQSRSLKQQAGDSFSAGTQQERYLKSQAKIAQSDIVLVNALKRMKTRETGDPNPAIPTGGEVVEASSLFDQITSLFQRAPRIHASDENPLAVQANLRVDAEANTDLLRISYRNRDPVRAADMANQIAGSFIDLHTKLSSNPLASQFFREQEDEYRKKLGAANKSLEEFSINNGAYSIEAQRKLYLTRRDKIITELSNTRNLIGKNTGELQSLRTQLASLKAKITLPSEIFGDNNFSGPAAAPSASFGADPPLLHVRLYQESAVRIININAELAGLRLKESNQKRDLDQVNLELQQLAGKAAEFARLEREVEQDEANILLYTRKGAEAQIENAWRSNERLSTMQIVHSASPPIRPIFPRASIVMPLAVLVGLMLGCACAILADLLRTGDRASVKGFAPREAVRRDAGFGARFGLPVEEVVGR
ncbi:uncharacterized protein involved in exopolysaccharide biosynthesis [Methylobacterium sp. BE186]|uniref:GumC family protein n=1 Tax=Methylobacterium sp. BE186 TaxID=2817715 RepID=UPI00285E55FD|nr:Wzz/FepE/Etk N-terminal domain-containing protein [Methylobacterium sp. BE186]MDR7038593.1 uncharacterized protein involved in exopolysaccharide biosynthesis [Methylobacterium sp. BE186]